MLSLKCAYYKNLQNSYEENLTMDIASVTFFLATAVARKVFVNTDYGALFALLRSKFNVQNSTV